MGLRRDAREAAVQYLFAQELHETTGNKSPEETSAFWHLHSASPKVRKLAEELIAGVLANMQNIDERISVACTNFAINRIANVDRNILRLAIYELIFNTGLDAPVIINEAVEIAKKYGAPDSAGFVNGIVDRIARQVRTNMRNSRVTRQEAAPAAPESQGPVEN